MKTLLVAVALLSLLAISLAYDFHSLNDENLLEEAYTSYKAREAREKFMKVLLFLGALSERFERSRQVLDIDDDDDDDEIEADSRPLANPRKFRNISDRLDGAMGWEGQRKTDSRLRGAIHGVWHTGAGVVTRNPAEFRRAGEQFSRMLRK